MFLKRIFKSRQIPKFIQISNETNRTMIISYLNLNAIYIKPLIHHCFSGIASPALMSKAMRYLEIPNGTPLWRRA